MAAKAAISILTFLSSVAFIGCGPTYHSLGLPTLHGPVVTQHGEIVSGVAGSSTSSRYYTLSENSTKFVNIPFPLAYVRFAINNRTDVGVKFWGFIESGGFAADYHYVLLDDLVNASFDIELSFPIRAESIFYRGGSFKSLVGVIPSVLVGSKSLYLGAKLVNIFDPGSSSVAIPGGFGGISLGTNLQRFGELRFTAETSFFPRAVESPLIFYTFGLQLGFSTE